MQQLLNPGCIKIPQASVFLPVKKKQKPKKQKQKTTKKTQTKPHLNFNSYNQR